jgi:dihydrofolate reductase
MAPSPPSQKPARSRATPATSASVPLVLIAAVAANGVIGSGNRLPWRLPEDLRRFRALTLGHAVIMGRRTWESLPRALDGRQNIVVTRRCDYAAAGADVVASLAEALACVRMPPPAYCIGGGELYRAALPLAGALELTEIARDFEGDVRFPALDRGEWREVARIAEAAPAGGGLAYAFVSYERVRAAPAD